MGSEMCIRDRKFLITRKQTSKSFAEHCNMFLDRHVAMLDDDLNSIVSNWEDLFWAAVSDFVPKKKISSKTQK